MSYDSDVASATSGRGEPDWDKIIKLCNRIRESIGTLSMAQAMGSVMRRVKNTDPNIQLHALTLLESCVSNCGQNFQLEITKSTFHADTKAILTGSNTDPRVAQRLKELLASWATEYKSNSKMNPLIKFIEQIRRDGVSFQPVQQSSTNTTATRPTTTSTVPASSQEDSDLEKAIQLSLLDTSKVPSAVSVTSLYPSVGETTAPSSQRQAPKKVARKKVRAIYDFVAAEDNELSFRAGEILTVLDSSDENWWAGETQLGKGLFPASFVSSNLSVEPEPSGVEKKEKHSAGGSSEKGKGKKVKGGQPKKAAVNEEKIDLFLEMIKGADVTSDENIAENATLLELEEECKKMKPVVDETISSLQVQEDEMLAINKKFEESLVLYRKLLAEGPRLSSPTTLLQQPSSVPPQTLSSPSEPTQYPTPPSTQAHNVLSSHIQPPPYTANSMATTNTTAYTPQPVQSLYTPQLSDQPMSAQLPSSLMYDGLRLGGPYNSLQQQQHVPINTYTQPQSSYSQRPDSVQQPISGVYPSPGMQLMSDAPSSFTTQYQPAFYPPQQPTQAVRQPLL